MNNNQTQAISLPLEEKEWNAAALMEYSASTMMVLVSNKLRVKKPVSSPAAPGNW